ncbi:antibiotic biosynthesis monooxygenase family protein [Streptomyces sp. NPDC001848]|uniref:antibiotic biosynthesis monooxygenase family protein n=1 Tax=Streptomyces sp. NPDC001848 TaxID=3364618 RepID=UPI0036D1F99A
MLRTVLEMRVREGYEGEFRATWLETARAAAELPGSVGQTLLRDPQDPQIHLIMADWADRASLEAFQKSPEREELSGRLETFRASARKRVLETVAHIPARPTQER